MLKVAGIHVPLDEEAACRGGADVFTGAVVCAVAKRLGLAEDDVEFVRVLRRSVDARRKSDVHFVVNAAVSVRDQAVEQRLAESGIARFEPYQPLQAPFIGSGRNDPAAKMTPPVVVGTGPAGLFAALYLARAGLRPVVLERGAQVGRRAQDVSALNSLGVLNPQSNIQFGEGGAGAFSDGKLTTNIKSPFAKHVLRWFVDAGAPEEILWQAKPHIGSDKLPAVVEAMRNEIIACGGAVLFDTQLTGFRFESGHLSAIEATHVRTGRVTEIPCEQAVLACGHSARDTFELLQGAGIHLEQKPFAIGVRIEHAQKLINRAQWGAAAGHPALEAADYKLSVHDCAGRSVYTFCMCPGGEVLCAASEEGGVATNGASVFARDGNYANAAVLVNVVPSDFGGSSDPLAGVRFQREIEQAAYQTVVAQGGVPYQAPAQTVAAFLEGATGLARDGRRKGDAGHSEGKLPDTSYERGVVACDLRTVLPGFVCDSLAEALPLFDRRIRGFASPDAVLIAPETRSSSPVRISRNDRLQAWLEGGSRETGCGIYPAGEGAGYAGGIMSAACDGLRVASRLVAG